MNSVSLVWGSCLKLGESPVICPCSHTNCNNMSFLVIPYSRGKAEPCKHGDARKLTNSLPVMVVDALEVSHFRGLEDRSYVFKFYLSSASHFNRYKARFQAEI